MNSVLTKTVTTLVMTKVMFESSVNSVLTKT